MSATAQRACCSARSEVMNHGPQSSATCVQSSSRRVDTPARAIVRRTAAAASVAALIRRVTYMEFYRLWRIVLGYKSLIAVATGTAAVAAVALTYALPSLYEASSLVIVRPEEKIRLSPNQGEGQEV